MSHARLELRDIHFSYPGGDKVLDGLSLAFPEGEATGIVGANGAGKSTLLLLMLGVLAPSRGEIILGSTPLTPRHLPLFRRHMGLAFQNPDDQLFMATVGEDVAFGPRNYGFDEDEVERRVTEALEQVGMEHLRRRSPFKLSGGEKRSAALAAVLALRPEILILDEPTASLDPKARRRVMEMLARFDHTRIITSHDLDMVLEVCRRVIVLDRGRVAADGPARELLADRELLERCGLELPLTLQGRGTRVDADSD